MANHTVTIPEYMTMSQRLVINFKTWDYVMVTVVKEGPGFITSQTECQDCAVIWLRTG